jgi:hypothetical protein
MAENNENSAIDRDKFYWKNDPILSQFSFEFSKKVRTVPMYNTVYYILQQGNVSLQEIIEELLKSNEKLSDELIKMSQNQLPKFFREE